MTEADKPELDGEHLDLPLLAATPIVIEIPARNQFVSFVRVVVATAAEIDPDMDESRIDDLKLVVSEATTNAIEAHKYSGADDRIRIECNLADDQIAVVVHDEGLGFEPSELPEMPEPEDPARLGFEAGLGVPLIQMLTDESEIHSDSDGTDVRLVVYTRQHRKQP